MRNLPTSHLYHFLIDFEKVFDSVIRKESGMSTQGRGEFGETNSYYQSKM